jgi:hypothetical protein
MEIMVASEVGNHALAAKLTMLYADHAQALTEASQGTGPEVGDAWSEVRAHRPASSPQAH